MARKSASQEDLQALLELVARLEGDVLKITQTNAALVEALNTTWAVLDRLTGRKPDPLLLSEPHAHQWRFVRPYVLSYHGRACFEGVTEACDCGTVRSRITTSGSLDEMAA